LTWFCGGVVTCAALDAAHATIRNKKWAVGNFVRFALHYEHHCQHTQSNNLHITREQFTMSVRFLMAIAIVLVISASSAIAQNQSGRKTDQTADLIAKLRKTIDLEKTDGTSLNELAKGIGDKAGVTVLINEAAFRTIDPNGNPGGLMVKVPQVRGMALATTLNHILGQLTATYLVLKDHLEIVPIEFAAKETKNIESTDDDGPVRLAQPLVSTIFKEKPLNDAVAEIAEEYNLTVIVSPQSGDARTGFVTARFLNTPADKALELLALQCDLRIVKKANAFMITSRDHANDLFNEQMERERTKIEIERSRTAPHFPPQPQPQPPPQPQPQPVPNPNPPPKQ
jgi:hypothetical protein